MDSELRRLCEGYWSEQECGILIAHHHQSMVVNLIEYKEQFDKYLAFIFIYRYMKYLYKGLELYVYGVGDYGFCGCLFES